MSGRNSTTWRLIDTGVRRAAENFALNRALLEGHQEGVSPHTLRFLSFKPSALLGFHQDVEQELNVDYCREQGIDIQRRVTGGGALYFDETQIGWELYLDKQTLGTADMSAIARRVCEAAARGISSLGVAAKYRPRNDIEVDGRKISGTGGAFDGDSILYQGTLLIDFDVEKMLRVLRIPAEKLSGKAIASARERVVNLKELLGELPSVEAVEAAMAQAFAEEFGVSFERAEEISAREQEIFAEALEEIDSEEWIYQHNRPVDTAPMVEGIYKSAGGLMRANVMLDPEKGRLKQLWLTGDFFIKPRRLVVDLEAALRNTKIDELDANLDAFFADYGAEMLQLTRDDFAAVIRLAIDNAQNPAAPAATGTA
ncbi:MAG: lipoate--protein ligase family protein [Gammaproteobacteria bacterium]|nr:lipoate--protein ligase family protein [Gammaproteobacteria bacterium]